MFSIYKLISTIQLNYAGAKDVEKATFQLGIILLDHTCLYT